MSEGLRAPRRLGLGDTCGPPMSAADKATACKCGHLGIAHQHPLPAPCRQGWDDAATASAMAAEPDLHKKMEIYADAHARQLAAGACPCIAFSPGAL